jgi:hypothetical protein
MSHSVRPYTVFLSQDLLTLGPTVPYTLAVDLSQPWTNSSINAFVIEKPNDMMLYRRPTIWYESSSNTIYNWGGWAYGYDETNNTWSDIWSFHPDGHGGGTGWKKGLQPSADGSSLTAPAGGLYAASSDKFYQLGGLQQPSWGKDPNIFLPGFTVFDSTTSEWRNSSSASATGSGFVALGEAQHVPNFGKSGLVVFLGGISTSKQTEFYNSDGIELVDTSLVTIYDIDSGAWLHQTADGAVPVARSAFCVTGAMSSDNNSFDL